MKQALSKIAFVIAIAGMGGYAWTALQGPQGLPYLREKQAEVRRLQEKNAALAQENQRKRERIERLKDNRDEQELEVRRNRKVKPGEAVFVLPEEK